MEYAPDEVRDAKHGGGDNEAQRTGSGRGHEEDSGREQ
jgi:hypothetical protein